MKRLKRLETPLREEELKSLKVGEEILLSGEVFTARDAAHRRFLSDLQGGKSLPFSPEGAVIFYAGPTPSPSGEGIGVIGPTTASRMDRYLDLLMEKGVKGFIGKGPRSTQAIESLRGRGVYFMALGGVAVYLSRFIKEAEIIAYEDLGPEAIYRLVLNDLPLVVGIDFKGNALLTGGVLG